MLKAINVKENTREVEFCYTGATSKDATEIANDLANSQYNEFTKLLTFSKSRFDDLVVGHPDTILILSDTTIKTLYCYDDTSIFVKDEKVRFTTSASPGVFLNCASWLRHRAFGHSVEYIQMDQPYLRAFWYSDKFRFNMPGLRNPALNPSIFRAKLELIVLGRKHKASF